MMKSPLIDDLLGLALREDLFAGDPTTELTVDEHVRARGHCIAKERIVVCGIPLIERLARVAGVAIAPEILIGEGDIAPSGSTIATFSGRARDLLMLERIALNLVQRMSGIATHTRAVMKAARGITILDTRKTTPGWRMLEKYAVNVGGARNHRTGLGDMILVKNNHIDANGGDVAATLSRVMNNRPPYMPVEVEVRSIEELAAALPFGPEIIMLDNMNDRTIARALRFIRENATGVEPKVEVSGGVQPERFRRLQSLGVRYASLSGLVGNARTVDISLRLVLSMTKRKSPGRTA